MQTIELRIELNETIIQELVWRALSPADLVLMPAFHAALESEYARAGTPPAGALLSGVSVSTCAGQLYAEITFPVAQDARPS